VADLLPGPIADSVACLVAKNGLAITDLAFWLVHPGGPKILQVTQEVMNLGEADLRWSWDSLREQGNMLSVAILDVLRRYLSDKNAPVGPGIMLAFGPGVSLELLLVHRC
jgi:alkylresorcinol/alkylpyrone synthase